MTVNQAELKKTPLHSMHVDAGARLVPFAGYEMPVQYEGIKAEHLHTRKAAGLFDVSHMGQLQVSGPSAQSDLERMLPIDLDNLDVNQMCLTFLLNEQGGILDDLIITRRGDQLFTLVVNGACKYADIEHIKRHLTQSELEYFESQALLALQGPQAEKVLCSWIQDGGSIVESLSFMQGVPLQLLEGDNEFLVYVSRSGYTGEDGFEISVPNEFAMPVANSLLEQDAVQWVGLGARDTLRLEAGLCLYGHDLNEQTTPIEAGFNWSIHKSRKPGGAKAGGFLGAQKILDQIERGVSRRRRGFVVQSKKPVREGSILTDKEGLEVGIVTSGGVSPTSDRLIAMGYISTDFIDSNETDLFAIVRGKPVPLSIEPLPFVVHNYRR